MPRALRKKSDPMVWPVLAFGLLALSGYCQSLSFEQANRLLNQRRELGGVYKGLSNGSVLISGGPGYLVVGHDLNPIRSYSANVLRRPVVEHPVGGFLGGGDTSHCVWRVNADGTRDTSFQSPAVSEPDVGNFRDFDVQRDGKVVVACQTPFMYVSNFLRMHDGIFRLNADGSVDESFNVTPKDYVDEVILLPDGKMIIMTGNSIARLLPNGANDPSFTETPASSSVDIALQADGKILKVSSGGVNRILPNGGYDPTFVTPNISQPEELEIQQDGRILVKSSGKVIRLLTNGQLDPTFSVSRGTETLTGMAIDQADHVFVSESSTVSVYSGRNRVKVPPLETATVLERSSQVDNGWSYLGTIPANTAHDYFDSNFPGT